MPQETPAQRALTASTLALVVAVAALLLFLPPFFERYLTAIAYVVGNALVLSTALLLHWIFLAIGARRMHRSVPGWLALAVVLFPVGGAAALILLSWFSDDRGRGAQRELTPRRAPRQTPSPRRPCAAAALAGG